MERTGFCVVLFAAASRREDGVPDFLSEILFLPAAAWTIDALAAAGAEQFFLVCEPALRDPLLACFPPGLTPVFSDGEIASLRTFLRGAGGRAVLVTEPLYLSRAGARVLAGENTLSREGTSSGLFRLDASCLADMLESGVTPENALAAEGGELLVPPAGADMPPLLLSLRDEASLLGAAAAARYEVLARHIAGGVRVLDPGAVYVDPRVTIGRGTLLLPGTILRGDTAIGENCEIGPNSMITSCTVGDHTVINASQCEQSAFGRHVTVGPFAYVRPHCTVGDNVRLGDFVEVKNSVIESGAKVSHLTYVGDADIGARANLGCGCVTVNYDGREKHRTTVAADAFIGCNTNLVAPVRVGEGAYIAAGSTITREVPAESLAIARSRQTVKENWAGKKRMK